MRKRPIPDRTFHDFRLSKSGDQRFRIRQDSCIFRPQNWEKGLVGNNANRRPRSINFELRQNIRSAPSKISYRTAWPTIKSPNCVDRQILCGSETSICGFREPKHVKCSVGGCFNKPSALDRLNLDETPKQFLIDVCDERSSRPTLSPFGSIKIRRTALLNDVKLISRL